MAKVFSFSSAWNETWWGLSSERLTIVNRERLRRRDRSRFRNSLERTSRSERYLRPVRTSYWMLINPSRPFHRSKMTMPYQHWMSISSRRTYWNIISSSGESGERWYWILITESPQLFLTSIKRESEWMVVLRITRPGVGTSLSHAEILSMIPEITHHTPRWRGSYHLDR